MLESLFNAVASLKTATAFKNFSSTDVFLWIYRNFKNAEHLWTGTFQGKHVYGIPVQLMSREKPCDFINPRKAGGVNLTSPPIGFSSCVF